MEDELNVVEKSVEEFLIDLMAEIDVHRNSRFINVRSASLPIDCSRIQTILSCI